METSSTTLKFSNQANLKMLRCLSLMCGPSYLDIPSGKSLKLCLWSKTGTEFCGHNMLLRSTLCYFFLSEGQMSIKTISIYFVYINELPNSLQKKGSI